MTRRLGDYEGVFEDCMERSGGLAMLWHKSDQATPLSCSIHHIDIQVSQLGVEGEWRFTRVYGW